MWFTPGNTEFTHSQWLRANYHYQKRNLWNEKPRDGRVRARHGGEGYNERRTGSTRLEVDTARRLGVDTARRLESDTARRLAVDTARRLEVEDGDGIRKREENIKNAARSPVQL
jgi:hypothetical protein